MKSTLMFIGLLLAAAGALAQPDPAAQRAAMEKISWLAGQWDGASTSRGREGETRSASTESVRLAAGGTALLIQGRHYRLLPDGKRGDIVHDTAGLINFDPATGKYRFTTQLQNGQGGVFDGAMQGNTFSWRLPLPQAHVRYDIARNERGQWTELGFYCRDGAECQQIFSMTLDRKGDAP